MGFILFISTKFSKLQATKNEFMELQINRSIFRACQSFNLAAGNRNFNIKSTVKSRKEKNWVKNVKFEEPQMILRVKMIKNNVNNNVIFTERCN